MIKNVVLTVDNIPLVGQLYLSEGKGPYPAVCICHGIPSGKTKDPGDGGYPELAQKMSRNGFATFIFNFRGAGESGGNFDLAGWARDLEAVIDYLYDLSELDRARLSLLGFSGGAAVAIHVAARDERIACVAACACLAEFSFLSDVDAPQQVVEHFRSIGVIRDKGFPKSAGEWLHGFRGIRPIDRVGEIAPRPLLLVHGNRDETVDISHARQLYKKAGEPRELVIIDGAGHRLRQEERAIRQVIGWLKSHCQA